MSHPLKTLLFEVEGVNGGINNQVVKTQANDLQRAWGEGLQYDIQIQPGLKENCTKKSENNFFGKKRKYSVLKTSAVAWMLNGLCLFMPSFLGAEILPEASVQGMAQQARVAAEQESSQQSGC